MTTVRQGDWPVFVIVHGVGLSHRVYGRLARALSSHGTVLAIDLPGYGGTRRPGAPVSVEEYAAIAAIMLDLLKINSFIAVGHSMGAQIAVELGLLGDSRASGVIAIGPVVDSERRTILHQSIALARDSSREPFATNMMVLRDYLACGMRWYLSGVRAMLRYDIAARVPSLTVPLLVIRGDHDFIAREMWCDALVGSATRGETRSVAGHRHVVAHSGPETTAALIAGFADGMTSP
jgi:pimeloyl-ACP methyl ester carboxylesterase